MTTESGDMVKRAYEDIRYPQVWIKMPAKSSRRKMMESMPFTASPETITSLLQMRQVGLIEGEPGYWKAADLDDGWEARSP